MNPITYFKEVKEELNRVTWPQKSEVAKLTATVIILSAIVAVYLGGLDLAFTRLLGILATR